jgi:hypothetical protein
MPPLFRGEEKEMTYAAILFLWALPREIIYILLFINKNKIRPKGSGGKTKNIKFGYNRFR